MSEWIKQATGLYDHGCCPKCKHSMMLAEKPKWPELYKCQVCGTEWLVIKGPDKETK